LTHDRFNQIDYTLQRGRLRSMAGQWAPSAILAESNSMGGPLIERLQREKVNVRAFNTTATSKAEAIEALALALENGQIALPNEADVDVLKRELIAYDQERLPSGQIHYGAPRGQHDDCVMSLAIAWHGVALAKPSTLSFKIAAL
jgi:phage terminase large subunit-like protein